MGNKQSRPAKRGVTYQPNVLSSSSKAVQVTTKATASNDAERITRTTTPAITKITTPATTRTTTTTTPETTAPADYSSLQDNESTTMAATTSDARKLTTSDTAPATTRPTTTATHGITVPADHFNVQENDSVATAATTSDAEEKTTNHTTSATATTTVINGTSVPADNFDARETLPVYSPAESSKALNQSDIDASEEDLIDQGIMSEECQTSAKEIREINARRSILEDDSISKAAEVLLVTFVRAINKELKEGVTTSHVHLSDLFTSDSSRFKNFEWKFDYKRYPELTKKLGPMLKNHYREKGFLIEELSCYGSSHPSTYQKRGTKELTSARDLILNNLAVHYSLMVKREQFQELREIPKWRPRRV